MNAVLRRKLLSAAWIVGLFVLWEFLCAAFEVSDIEKEYARLASAGVVFTTKPVRTGPVTIAVLSDTCGNLIQIYQPAM